MMFTFLQKIQLCGEISESRNYITVQDKDLFMPLIASGRPTDHGCMQSAIYSLKFLTVVIFLIFKT
jgi:hypothetical protein